MQRRLQVHGSRPNEDPGTKVGRTTRKKRRVKPGGRQVIWRQRRQRLPSRDGPRAGRRGAGSGRTATSPSPLSIWYHSVGRCCAST
jgi:hypothetical protein